ncbi:MAG: response regulator [Gammaproteobacteria bacterium]
MSAGASPPPRPLILVIEDDRLHAGYLKDLLEAHEYTVVTAGGGVEGLKLLHEHPPSLVLTDILMPEVDGIECIRSIRELPNPPPIIAFSGGGRVDAEMYLKLAIQLGAQQVFRKPIPDEALCAAIGRLLHAA